MLTFAEQLAQLEAEVVRVSGLNLKQFDELASYVSRVSALTGLSVEDVTQILQGASAHTGISMSDLAKTLEDLVFEIKEKGEEEDMAITVPYKEIGKYQGIRVIEVSLNDYITMLLANDLEDIYYVITDTLVVAKKDWAIGRITTNRRNITETKHANMRTLYAPEIRRRTPVPTAQRMIKGVSGSLITSRPTIAAYVKEGEKRMAEQARRGRELIESLKRPENG